MPSSPWSAVVRANVALAPGAQKDAFDRLRTSQPFELFSRALEYGTQPLFYEDVLAGGATSSYNANAAVMDLGVSTAGDKVIRQSREYVRYRPGKSQQIFVTGNFQGPEAGVVKRMGLFDDDTQTESTGDGIFFEVDETGIFAVLRSSVSGVSTDTRVPQASWNVDRMDGTGPSGLTLDLTMIQVCVFSFGWLGAAIIRWCLVVDGRLIIVHEDFPSNQIPLPYMRHPSLPVRWEMESTGVGASGTMNATCASVQSEGGFNTLGVQRSASRGGTARTTSALGLYPLVSVRLKPGYLRGNIIPEGFSVLAEGSSPENYEAVVLVNATLTGSTWAAGSTEAAVYDTAATSVSGGRLLASVYGAAGGGGVKSGAAGISLTSDVSLGSSYAGVPDTLTLAVRPLGTANTRFFGSLLWREFY